MIASVDPRQPHGPKLWLQTVLGAIFLAAAVLVPWFIIAMAQQYWLDR